MINVIQTALSGLQASAKKVAASASNIANLQTEGSLKDPGKAPYTPLTTVQTTVTDGTGNGLGVRTDYAAKSPAFVPAYDPGSPFADENGIIGAPAIDLIEESVNLQLAKLTYKANASVIRTAREMDEDLLKAFDKQA